MTERPEGLKCESCGEKHLRWEKIGTHAVGGHPSHSGLADLVQCGNCGAKQEVNLRR